MLDGDTIFALATGSAGRANVSVIGAFAAEATAQAIRRAAQMATSLGGLPNGASVGAG
jgi:L-aminopeptidase/D-esterase-like protein